MRNYKGIFKIIQESRWFSSSMRIQLLKWGGDIELAKVQLSEASVTLLETM